MIIRKALMEDVEALIEIGKRGHEASDNRAYEFDELRGKLFIASCICNKGTCAFVAEVDGKIVGFIYGKEEQYPYVKMRYATDLAIYSEAPGAGRALIDRFTKWAFEDRKVEQLILAVSHGGKSAQGVTALYHRLGFELVGGLFTKQRQA